MGHLRAALLLLGLYGMQDAACVCAKASAQLDSLLAEYDREAPTAARVSVQLSLDLRHATVQDEASSLRILADLHLSWQDPRLSWNATEWGCEWTLAAAERLWRPDVELVNAAAAVAAEEPLRARLAADGGVAWTRRLDAAVPVSLRLEAWPADVQSAVFKFASREHPQDELELTIRDLEFASVFETGGWEVVSMSSDLGSLEGGEAGARSMAAWTVSLRRRAAARALAARAAAAAAALLLAGAALLPPQQRAPLLAAAALTAAMWLSTSVWRVTGSSTPAAVRGAGALCVLAAAAAMGAAAAARLARLGRPPPRALRDFLASASRLGVVAPPAEEGGGECGAWVSAARLLDAALLLVLALALLVSLALYL